MKLLYVSFSILPSQYANSVHVMKMCRALSKKEIDVTLFGLAGDKQLGEKEIFEYYNVSETFELNLVEQGKKNFVKRIYTIIQLIQRNDLIYTRYTLAAYISMLLRKPVIYEYHGIIDGKINQFFEKRLAGSCFVKHVFITKSLYDEYCKNIEALKNADCIVLSDCADPPSEEICNVVSTPLSCGYIGSFQQGKGIELVLAIAERMPETTFHIVGGKADEVERLKETHPSNNIIWYGFLQQKDAMRILNKKIDIALLPNQKKVLVGKKGATDIGSFTSPMKLFEYMSYRKAIIASRLDVLEEVIDDEEDALLVDYNNVDEWVNAIRYLQENPTVFEQLRNKAQEKFEKNYTWDARVDKLIEKFCIEEK